LSAVAGISPSRQAAFRILLEVERGNAHTDEMLRGKPLDAMSQADRNLTTALVLGVLRWQIGLDAEIKRLLKKPNARLDAEVLIALRLGAFQLVFLERVPTHAAIDESVELAKQAGHRFAAGMVNAVLRNLAVLKRRDFSRAASPPKPTEALASAGQPATEAGFAYTHPAWMVERWADFYGIDTARAICRHGQERPPVSVRIASADVEAELAQDGIALGPGQLLTAARIVTSGDVTGTPAFQAGHVRIQDEGSQLIGELAACVGSGLDQGTKRIVDLCAAPGGKTLILAERNPPASIVACEASRPRLKELRNRLAVFAERIDCRLADATALRFDSEFDIALADVPCSGTGTLSRNPEIRHRLQPDNLPRQAERQRAILASALRAVRPGGRVAYSTCSLEPEENEEVIAAVLSANRKARVLPVSPMLDALGDHGILNPGAEKKLQACVTREGFLRLIPGAFGTDGFFIAMIEGDG